MAAVLGIVALWTLRQPRIYQAMATVIIDPQAPQVLNPLVADVISLGAGNYWSNEDYYNTQFWILKSKNLSRQVVREHGFHKDSRFPVRPGAATDEEQIARVAEYVRGGLRVLPVKGSRVVGIAMRSEDPQLATDVANATVETYVAQNVKVKSVRTRGATEWVGEQLETSREAVKVAETAQYQFERENKILSVDLQDRQNMIAEALQKFSADMTSAQSRRIDLTARRKAIMALIKEDALLAPSSYVSTDRAMEEMRATYNEERRKLVTFEESYGPKHPTVKQQSANVAATLRDLTKQAERLVHSIDAEIDALGDAQAKYQTQVNSLTEQGLDLKELQIEHRRLARQTASAEKSYNDLLTRHSESDLQSQDRANNIQPQDEATKPLAPIEPNLVRMLGVGIALALLCSLGLAFLLEILDRSIKGHEELEGMGLTFLGLVPSVAMPPPSTLESKELHVLLHPNSAAAECYRAIRTNLLFCSPGKPLRSMLVTSANPVEGKTISVSNLGAVFAQSGKRTLLVDTDMRRPRLHHVLKCSNERGVSDLIVGETKLADAVQATSVENLFFLACGPIPPNPAELLQTDAFAQLVATLASEFDRVLFDSPPVLAVTDAVVISSVVDGSLMVARAGKTTKEAAARARQLLASVGGNLIGAILNDVNLSSPHYDGYQYYNYKYHEAGAGVTPAGKT